MASNAPIASRASTASAAGRSLVLKGRPAKVLKALPRYALIGQAVRAEEARLRSVGNQLLLGWLVALGVGVVTMADGPGRWPVFAQVSATGLLFWFVAGPALLLARRRSLGLRNGLVVAVILFVVFFVGVWIAGMASIVLQATERTIGSAPSLREQPAAILLGATVASLFVTGVIWRARAKRVGDVAVSEPELAWLRDLLSGLLRDAPPDASVTVRFNPFQAAWSEVRGEAPIKRSGYSFPMATDHPLMLTVDFGGGLRFGLGVQTSHVTKIKRRKSKYKGTKYRLRTVLRFQHPWLEGADLRGLRAAAEEATGTAAGFVAERPVVEGVEHVGLRDHRVRRSVKLEGPRLILGWDLKHQDRNGGDTQLYLEPDQVAAVARHVGKRLATLLDRVGLDRAGQGLA